MKNILFMGILLLFCGCAKVNLNYFNSSITSTINTNYEVVANDLVDFISQHFSPNTTSFYLKTEDGNKEFYNHLSNTLRNKGYGISDNNNLKGLDYLSYTIQDLSPNEILVICNINESKLNRIYTLDNNKLIPSSSITSFNFEIKDENE